jgi:hypothetical protein
VQSLQTSQWRILSYLSQQLGPVSKASRLYLLQTLRTDERYNFWLQAERGHPEEDGGRGLRQIPFGRGTLQQAEISRRG